MRLIALGLLVITLFLSSCSNSDPYRSGNERAVLLTDQLDLAFPGGYLREKTKEEYLTIVKRMEGNLIEETNFEEEALSLYLQGFFDHMLNYHDDIQRKAVEGQLDEPPWKKKKLEKEL